MFENISVVRVFVILDWIDGCCKICKYYKLFL